ncbi:MAG: OmpA family protein [Elusimicrobia bacterium]|nr:OmpA family protein [Elusimicrobiota bacterium]
MKKILGLMMMLLLAVCITSCGTKYARPDRCVCEMDDHVTAPAPAPVPEPEPEPEPEPAQPIKEVIEEAIKEEKKEFTIDFEKIANKNLFEFDSDKLAADSHEGLDVVVNFMKETPNVTVKLEGHTDSIGSQVYNQNLSERRANAVAKYLISHGIEKERVSTEGFGFSRPIASNKTAEGRAQNRRTEMKFTINDLVNQDEATKSGELKEVIQEESGEASAAQ